MFIERRGPQRWRARVRGLDGKERSRTFARRTDAEKWATAMEASKATGEWLDPRLGKTRFEDFAAEWFATTVHLKPSTRASYRTMLDRYVLPTFGAARLTDVTRTRVQAWMAELIASGTGPGTVRNAYRTLSRILTEAERARLIARNPAGGIPLPKSRRREMRFLEPPEIARLADAIEPRYRALVLTAGFTGAR
jgi:integrase